MSQFLYQFFKGIYEQEQGEKVQANVIFQDPLTIHTEGIHSKWIKCVLTSAQSDELQVKGCPLLLWLN